MRERWLDLCITGEHLVAELLSSPTNPTNTNNLTDIVGVVDIESSPDIAYIYGPKWEPKVVAYNQYSFVMAFSWKWLDGKQITKCILDYKDGEEGLLKELWELINRAEVVIGWNSDKFDLPTLNTRFAKYGMGPPSPVKSIDLIKTSRTKFRLPSNSLNDFAEFFELKRKLDNERNLFIKCAERDKRAYKLLKTYNANDTLITHEAFKFIQPWIKSNLSVYSEKTSCPKCGSQKLQRRGFAFANSTKYQRIQCMTCGGWSRLGINLKESRPLISL